MSSNVYIRVKSFTYYYTITILEYSAFDPIFNFASVFYMLICFHVTNLHHFIVVMSFLMFVWESIFSFIFVRQLSQTFWVYVWLAVFFFKHFEYIIPLSSPTRFCQGNLIACGDFIAWNDIFFLSEFKILSFSLIVISFIILCLIQVFFWSNLCGCRVFIYLDGPYLCPTLGGIQPSLL